MWKSDKDKLRRYRIDHGIIEADDDSGSATVEVAPPKAAVTVYYRRGCPYTRAALDLLKEREIPVNEVDTTDDQGLQAHVKRLTGSTSTPQIVIHDRPIGGFDALRELVFKGELEAMIAGETPATDVSAEPESTSTSETSTTEATATATKKKKKKKKKNKKNKKKKLTVLHPERSPFEELDNEDVVPLGEELLEGKELVSRVLEVLDEVRPMVQSDGGDIELLDVQGGIVSVKLTGNCIGCPSAQATLKQGIERRLLQRIPQLTGISSPQL